MQTTNSRIKVVHKRLGILHGEVVARQGRQALVKLDAFREPAWVDQRYISEIGACEDVEQVGDAAADHQQRAL